MVCGRGAAVLASHMLRMSELLILKLVLVPPLIAGVSLAGRRWGPGVSGWLVGLPLSSAPISLFLALEQGPTFAARAAQGTLLGLISVAAFCLAYDWLARRWTWTPSTLGGWVVFLAATAALDRTTLGLGTSFVAVVAVIAAAVALLPVRQGSPQAVRLPWWDIPLRVAAATAMVIGITGAAALLGPHLSGLLTPFPVYATVLAAFTHVFQGADETGRFLRGVVGGLFSFATFFLIVALGLERWGISATFGLAVVVTLLMHGVLLRLFHLNSLGVAMAPLEGAGRWRRVDPSRPGRRCGGQSRSRTPERSDRRARESQRG